MSGVAEIVSRIRISDVWQALGGAELRHGRGPAFWRGGDGFNVALNDSKGAWFDHASGEGGGVLDLVQKVRGTTKADALRWLADLTGVAFDERPRSSMTVHAYSDAARIRHDALYFSDAARNMAEWSLEVLSTTDAERAVHTALLAALRASPETEYHDWLKHQPEWAAALVHAGRERAKRLQLALARYLATEGPNAAA
jgi:hypothetical protein